ncbi:hypothetical protein DL96DRAFT_373786 [Flagelloscypha sp. PMI_526]|nr:hypothetical protein DL96DRAFT_373786 [Flagelloscypha sp. PMI_526]
MSSTILSTIEVVQHSHAVHSRWLPNFSAIQIESMEQDMVIATFARPWNPQLINKWWEEKALETERPRDRTTDATVQQGARAILMAFEKVVGREEDELIGECLTTSIKSFQSQFFCFPFQIEEYIMLVAAFNQTAPFRSTVEKLIVSPRHRKKGARRLLMTRLEELALRKRRTHSS